MGMDEYGQAHYCNEYYDDDLDLVKADESSCGGDHLVSSETSTFVNAFLFVNSAIIQSRKRKITTNWLVWLVFQK